MNYQGIPTGNPWNPVVATPWPTETVLSRSLPPSLAESPCLVVVNDEELPAARVVALARLGWSGYSEPTSFPSLHDEIGCRPSGKGLRLGVHSKQITTLSPLTLYFYDFFLNMWHCIGCFSCKGIVAAFYHLFLSVVMEFPTYFFLDIHYCRAPLHEECPKHHWHKGGSRVTLGTCGTMGEGPVH